MSSRYSMTIEICEEDEVVCEFRGILVADVQPLVDLIRHHGVASPKTGDYYRFAGKTYFTPGTFMVMVEIADLELDQQEDR